MKWLKRLSISLTIAFFAVCCGAVLLFNWGSMGWKALSVPTGSMRPHIPPGSLVLTHSVPLSSIKVGDVITYINPDNMKSTVTHRVIKEYKLNGKVPAFITKGDANPNRDQWTVVGGLVQGKAVWHVPDVGAWLSWTKTWVGLAALVYVPAFLLVLEEIFRLKDYFRASQPYKAIQIMAREARERRKRKNLVPASAISLALIIAPVLVAFPVYGLLASNTVALTPNVLTVAPIVTPPPPPTCTNNSSTTITVTGNSNSNINVNNSNNQNSHSGNSTVNGNGTATSGNASNTNCTNINITVH